MITKKKSFPTPRLTPPEFQEFVKRIVQHRWLVQSYDSYTAQTVFKMTEEGGKYYVIAAILLDKTRIFSGPNISPSRQVSVDTSLANPDVRTLFEEGFVTKTISKYTGEAKIEFTDFGAKWFFVFTSMIDRKSMPEPGMDKVTRGLYKATRIMGGINDFVSDLTESFNQPYGKSVQSNKFNRPSKSYNKPAPRKTKQYPKQYGRNDRYQRGYQSPRYEREDLADKLSSFPKSDRHDWMDLD